jgi:hypothetical protein
MLPDLLSCLLVFANNYGLNLHHLSVIQLHTHPIINQSINQAINCQGNALLVPKHSGQKASSISSKILLKEDIRFRNRSSNSIVEGQQTLDKTTKTCKSFEEMGCIPRQRGDKAQGGL